MQPVAQLVWQGPCGLIGSSYLKLGWGGTGAGYRAGLAERMPCPFFTSLAGVPIEVLVKLIPVRIRLKTKSGFAAPEVLKPIRP